MPFPLPPERIGPGAAWVRTLLRTLLLLCAVSLLAPCGQDSGQGTDAPTILPIGFEPKTFPRAPGTGVIVGFFGYVAPSADLSAGYLDIRPCGQDPEERLEVPFQDITERPVGFFAVQWPVPTDCDPGDYVAQFWVLDRRGTVSNRFDVRYTIEEPA